MVWPHNNDIGKEKPKEPAIPSWANFTLKATDAELMAMSSEAFAKAMQAMPLHGIEQQSKWLKPKNPQPKTYANTMAHIDELMKLQWSHNEIYNQPPNPVLIDGPKGNYSFQDKDKYPTTIPVKQLRIEMRVGGIGLDTEKMGASYLIPDHEVTEKELRAILEQQFKALENLIVDNLKKAKGIK